MVGPVSPCKVLRKVWPAVFTMVLKHRAIDSLELQVITLVFLTVRIPFSSRLSSQFSCVCTKLDKIRVRDLGILLCTKIPAAIILRIKELETIFFFFCCSFFIRMLYFCSLKYCCALRFLSPIVLVQ